MKKLRDRKDVEIHTFPATMDAQAFVEGTLATRRAHAKECSGLACGAPLLRVIPLDQREVYSEALSIVVAEVGPHVKAVWVVDVETAQLCVRRADGDEKLMQLRVFEQLQN